MMLFQSGWLISEDVLFSSLPSACWDEKWWMDKHTICSTALCSLVHTCLDKKRSRWGCIQLQSVLCKCTNQVCELVHSHLFPYHHSSFSSQWACIKDTQVFLYGWVKSETMMKQWVTDRWSELGFVAPAATSSSDVTVSWSTHGASLIFRRCVVAV